MRSPQSGYSDAVGLPRCPSQRKYAENSAISLRQQRGRHDQADGNTQRVPLDTGSTAEERERLGRQGAALIEAAVKAMDVKA